MKIASAPMPGLMMGSAMRVKGGQLAGTVNAGSLEHLAGDTLAELLHQEDAERPAHDREDDRPDRVVQLQAAHLTQQGGIRMTCLGRAMAQTISVNSTPRPMKRFLASA